MRGRLPILILIASALISRAADEPGSIAWEVPAGVVHHAPAVGADGSVYVATTDAFSTVNTMIALAADQTVQWQAPLQSSAMAAPAIAPDGGIYLAVGSALYRFNSRGNSEWSFPAGGPVQSAPAITGDGLVLLGAPNGFLYALETDGQVAWRFDAGAPLGSPVIDRNGNVYVGSVDPFDEDPRLWALAEDGSLRWSIELSGSVSGSPLIFVNDSVLVPTRDGRLSLIEPSGDTRWVFFGETSWGSSPIVDAQNTILAGDLEGWFYALDASGTELWRIDLGAPIRAAAAADAGGLVYVINELGTLFALGQDGAVLWIRELDGFGAAAPTIASDPLLILGTGLPEGRLVAVHIESAVADSVWPIFRQNALHTGCAPGDPNRPPTLVGEAQDVILIEGESHLIEIEVEGTEPFTFQWFKDGEEIENATAASLSLESVSIEDAGEYHVEIENAFGSAVSRPALVRVLPQVKFLTAPLAGEETAIGSVNLTMNASAFGFEARYFGLNAPPEALRVIGTEGEDASVIFELEVEELQPESGAFSGEIPFSRTELAMILENQSRIELLAGAEIALSGQVRARTNSPPSIGAIEPVRLFQGEELEVPLEIDDVESGSEDLDVRVISSEPGLIESIEVAGGGGDRTIQIQAGEATGTTVLHVAAIDPEGMVGLRRIEARVEVEPVVIRVASRNVRAGETVRVPLIVENFQAVTSFQSSILWDPEILDWTGVSEPGLEGLDESDFEEPEAGVLVLNWETANPDGESVPDGAMLFALEFRAVGSLGEATEVALAGDPEEIRVAVGGQEAVVELHAGQVEIVDVIRISGRVVYFSEARPVPDVPVALEGLDGAVIQTAVTDPDGRFEFVSPGGVDYRVRPLPPDDPAPSAGVSTLDITLLRRHILGLGSFTIPYQYLAGDANESESISTLDITLIRRVVLGLNDTFSGGGWRFVDADADLPETGYPESFPSSRLIDGGGADATGIDFVAVKVGDVNGSWTPQGNDLGLNSVTVAAESSGPDVWLKPDIVDVPHGTSEAAFALRLRTEAGIDYVVESTSDLRTGPWELMARVEGNGGEQIVMEDRQEGRARFFRVRRQSRLGSNRAVR